MKSDHSEKDMIEDGQYLIRSPFTTPIQETDWANSLMYKKVYFSASICTEWPMKGFCEIWREGTSRQLKQLRQILRQFIQGFRFHRSQNSLFSVGK